MEDLDQETLNLVLSLGVTKETIQEILDEFTLNITKYADNQKELELLLEEKLGKDICEKLKSM